MVSEDNSSDVHSFHYIMLCVFFFFFLAVLGLCCCKGFSQVVASRGYFLVAVCGLLITVAFLVAEYSL